MEIQLLRAVAVIGVVVCHLWPERLPGGFAGVDVFFVVSGYLISAHLLTQLQRDGRIGFTRFWGRRIRRLLPAAFTVLFAAVALTLTVVPAPARESSLAQIVASAFYVQNWVLAATSVDYFSLEQPPTLVQHFWSLSVEEQFYLFWPVFLVVIWTIARRRPRHLVATIAILSAVSFVIAVIQSSSPGTGVYFSTAARVWEFGVGALLALTPALPRGELPAHLTETRRWAGLIGIAAIVATYVAVGPETPYPGIATLLPVAGTVLVMIGGTPRARISLGPLARARPISHLGDVSYSLYLWHWPLIVVAPAVLLSVGGLTTAWRFGIIALSLLLAAATKRFVEDRFRYRGGQTHPRRTLLIPALGCATLLLVVVGAQALVLAPQAAASERRLSALERSECFGAQAVTNGCADPFGPADTIDPAIAATDRSPDCVEAVTTPAPAGSLATCDYPVGAAAPRVLALVGDSHAGAVASTVASWARSKGMTVRLYALSACPGFGVNTRLGFPNEVRATSAADRSQWDECVQFSDGVLDEIRTDPAIVSVLVTNSTLSYLDADSPEDGALTVSSVRDAIRALADAGKRVVVMEDVPGLAFGDSAPMCLALHPDDPVACAAPLKSVLSPDDPVVGAAESEGVPTITLRDLFCDARRCHAAIGGVVAYWDRAHLTATMLRSLSPLLHERLDHAFERARR